MTPENLSRLRELASATRIEYRVANPATKAYCMQFDYSDSPNPERDACDWLADYRRRHPNGRYAKFEVMRVVLRSELQQLAGELVDEYDRLTAIVNTPQANDFLRAVSTEAEHQRQRWPSEHDAGKTPADWFWLIGYLAGKALHAHTSSNAEKAEHHVITTAAACANWHLAMRGKTNMRPGIDSTKLQEASHGL